MTDLPGADLPGAAVGAAGCAVPDAPPRRRLALSPSRAADFKQCPLLYRFRAVDRLPETPSRVQVRGTVVHAALERLFALPAEQRLPQVARDMVEPAWREALEASPDLADLFGPGESPAGDSQPDGTGVTGESAAGGDAPDLADWLESARALVDGYFTLEDPRRINPEACELLVEAELPALDPAAEPVLLRGYIDRLDVAPTGEIRVVDYKSGAAPREVFEAKALFQMKFYALVLLRTRGVVPRQLRLMYLADRQALSYTPEEAELLRFERTLAAIWSAIRRAAETGDFRPSPGRMCDWCDHKPRCPAFGGTPPPYPGWPDPEGAGIETARDRAD